MRSLDIASTGMQAQQTNVDVISNNLANMTTTGFKRRRSEFQDLIYENMRRVGSNTSDSGTVVPAGAQVGLGRAHGGDLPHQRAGHATTDLQQPGPGDPRQRVFSGDAALRRHRLYPGRHVRPVAGRHGGHGGRLPDRRRHHDPAQRHPPSRSAPTARCRRAWTGRRRRRRWAPSNSPPSPTRRGWTRRGDNLFLQSGASGNAVTGNPGSPGFGSVLQGFVESSNVNVVTEISNLITAQRAYEMNSKVITTSDQMLSTLTNLR